MGAISMDNLEVKMSKKYIYIKLPGGVKAYLRYEIIDNVMKLLETYTPPEYRGKGLAAKLVTYALEYAKNKGLRVKPICSYTIRYFIKHPEYRSLLVEEYKNISLEEAFEKRLEEEKGLK